MLIERCIIYHESTSNAIRIEDVKTLKLNVNNIFDEYEALLRDLTRHRRRVLEISAELL